MNIDEELKIITQKVGARLAVSGLHGLSKALRGEAFLDMIADEIHLCFTAKFAAAWREETEVANDDGTVTKYITEIRAVCPHVGMPERAHFEWMKDQRPKGGK